MNAFSTAYLILAAALIAACVLLYVRRQRALETDSRILLPIILMLIIVAISGLWTGNSAFIGLWLRGEPVSFAIRTPFGVPAPAYYIGGLAIMASPILMLLPPVFRRPWLLASLAAFATFPITYSALTPGC